MNLFNVRLLTITAFLMTVFSTSCLRDDFDRPPVNQDPVFAPEQIVSLQEVMALYKAGEFVKINMDKYIQAVVVADDKSGNFYKSIVVEDEKSNLGISLVIDENEIHAQYPVGRRVFIHLKDLYISDYNGLPQIGYGTELDSSNRLRMKGIPPVLLKDILVKGTFNIAVNPEKTSIELLGTSKLNTLVQLDDVEFKSVNPNTTYADNNPASPQSVNHTLVDCKGNEIIVRNSGYADFAGEKLPLKNGSIVGVYTVFGSTRQLMIRDTSDLKFNLDRCAERGAKERISIREMRTAYANGSPSIKEGSFLQGVVISDVVGNNWDSRNIVVQDVDAGIVCRFTAAPNIPIGKEVKVILTGRTMTLFNGLLQVADIPSQNLIIIGDGAAPAPKVLQIKDISSTQHESTLVQIKDAEFSGGATYGTNGVSIKDASGTIQVYTRSAATFSASPVKSGKVTVTAIVGKFNANTQLQLRGLYDVQ